MTDLANWLNPTRIIGLIAYLFATTCCAIAWRRARGIQRVDRLAATLTLVEAALFMDVVFSVRLQLHDLLENEAIRESLYDERLGPQLVALGLLCVTAALGVRFAVQRLRGRMSATAALCGAILSLSCWCAEVISWHATDAVLYRQVHGVMLVSLCWIAFSLITGLGILLDARLARSGEIQAAKPTAKPQPSLTDSSQRNR